MTLCVSSFILYTVWCGGGFQERQQDVCLRAYCFLKVFMMAMSAFAFHFWPSRGGALLIFPGVSVLNFGISLCANGVVFSMNALVTLLVAVICGGMIVGYEAADGERSEYLLFDMRPVIIVICASVTSIAVSRIQSTQKRRGWQALVTSSKELTKLRTILLDLLPEYYADRLMMGLDDIPSLDSRIVVLQFDLAGFTVMAQEVGATELAIKMHELFSAFDNAVMKRDLFKLDTIGDAFIAIGWLKKESDSPLPHELQHNLRKCEDILSVAADFLNILSGSSVGGRVLSGRIGISLGNVVAGVLKGLQPRFCVLGEAMQEVASLETNGVCGTVNVSKPFLQFVAPIAAAAAAPVCAARGEGCIKDGTSPAVVQEVDLNQESIDIGMIGWRLGMEKGLHGKEDNEGKGGYTLILCGDAHDTFTHTLESTHTLTNAKTPRILKGLVSPV